MSDVPSITERFTQALLLYLQEKGYAARLYNGWQIYVPSLGAGTNPILSVHSHEVWIDLGNHQEYVNLSDPDCMDKIEGWLIGSDRCRNSGSKVECLRPDA